MEDDLRWREMREQRLKDRQVARDAAEDQASGTATPVEDDDDAADLAEFEEQEDEDLYFAPERGNVVFASAIDGWRSSAQP